MPFSVTFRHMDASEAVRNYAREKIDKIKKYVPDPIFAHITVVRIAATSTPPTCTSSSTTAWPSRAAETSEDMYSSIDLVMDKVERQVRR